jgi:hypothetical protein
LAFSSTSGISQLLEARHSWLSLDSARKQHLENLDDTMKVLQSATRLATQPFSERRYARSRNDSDKDDKDAYDGDKPWRVHSEYHCRNHDGQDDGANT